MVATLVQAASAAYYLESQRSFRHPNEYYTAGEEPDGVWFNPKGLLGLENGGKVDSGDFHRLYHGFAPDGSTRLTRNAGSEQRSAGLDMTFSADKSVSALWAVADPELRARIEDAHNDAARVALEETVLRYCAYTRIRDREGRIKVLPADIPVAMFQHGTSRENDPQLHTHCVIFNAARTRDDGKWRAMHQYPVYSWAKAAGAVYRNALAWNLCERLGVQMEQYGPDAAFTRIEGMPEDLQAFWSKRRKTIVAKAGELGIPSRGNASRMAGVNKLTRAGKSHDNDPEIRHGRWREEAEGFAEREELIRSVTGREAGIGRERIRELTARLDELPAHLARQEAVFRRPDMVEAAANAAAGLIGPEALKTAIERLRRNPEIERLEPKKPTAESLAGMAHTEVYSTRHNLGLEQAVKDMASSMAADAGYGIPEDAVRHKVETLLAGGYPLSQEQSLAIRHATAKGGRVAVIEGAAGSGKTTTLRPITDLHREHGYEIVPTAVAWRTAVALGDDCDARPFCVDKLLKLAAKGQLEIGKNTLIVVDEAGMLSTRQAHHILQLSERHGAKVVFTGDTRQQQPVEAGPGLRLIRDVAGSVRVDRIRRQKADLEDVLVHVHKEPPEQARFAAALTNPQERERILADYEAMEKKPLFTPWQVAVSEALRDGEAEKAIEAWQLRGRLHLHYDEEKTLTGLVNDWARLAKAEPQKSAVVLARTKAEARALSWLMRERVLGESTDIKRAVIEVSRDLDGRVTEPLEIAVGDRLRIGATQWQKQLFNGTVVTVEDIHVKQAEGVAVSRKARNRQAAGRAEQGAEAGDEFKAESGNEFPVHITARTDDGRRVSFRHDEIRDYHDNIRIDYGYAMTIASAQGLTVDRAFLLIDDRPSRETIYPAATRHREGIDVYVNRSPIVFDIAESRPEDEAERPVLDSEVRAYLAERWSRSRPKEAALDYIADGAWRDASEGAQLRAQPGAQRRAQLGRAGAGNGATRPAGAMRGGPGEAQREAAEDRTAAETVAAANDNAIVRIAQDIRHAVNGWRHGTAVDAFAAERTEVMAAWDDLRRRARAEGDAVALSPAFRETLDRHGALMKQAASFRRRPQVFERLLAERAGIGQGEIEEFRRQHARAGKYLRSVSARAAHRARQDTQRQDAQREEAQIAEAIAAEAVAAGVAVPADDPAPEPLAPSRPIEADEIAPGPERDAPPDWRTLYRELQRDWNDLVARANRPDLPLLLMDGYDGLIQRVRALSDHPDLTERAHDVLAGLLDYHDDETAAQETAEGYLAAAERHVEVHKVLEAQAGERGLSIARLDAWPQWRDAAEMLAATGEAVLANEDRYGAWLDAMIIGRSRAELTVEQLRNRLDESRAARPEVSQRRREPTPKQEQGFAHILEERRKAEARSSRKGKGEQQGFAHTLDRPPAKPLAPSESQKGFAHILDDPEKLRELREKAEKRDRKLGRHMRRSRGLSM
ncbi:MAG: relaxase domain-containing protein [Defluviicoccus sp.]|nr:relaxase domain-containing protein [Defluviicoccus sp.]